MTNARYAGHWAISACVERVAVCETSRDFEIEHEEGDGDGEHPIAERFDPTGFAGRHHTLTGSTLVNSWISDARGVQPAGA